MKLFCQFVELGDPTIHIVRIPEGATLHDVRGIIAAVLHLADDAAQLLRVFVPHIVCAPVIEDDSIFHRIARGDQAIVQVKLRESELCEPTCAVQPWLQRWQFMDIIHMVVVCPPPSTELAPPPAARGFFKCTFLVHRVAT